MSASARQDAQTGASPPGLLEGIVVLDMSQFLSGPFSALRLADLGARVIKIERPDGGDLSRGLYLSDGEPWFATEERIIFLGPREALIWLNESPQDQGSFWE